MSLRIKEGYLPTEAPSNILGYPTYGRWETSLPAAVGTVADAVSDAGAAKDSAIMISDGTPDYTNEQRAAQLDRFYGPTGTQPEMPIHVLTHETQQKVVDALEQQTGLKRKVIESVVARTSCGDNRQKLAVVTSAYVTGTNRELVLGLIDDDIEAPRMYDRATGFGETPNSQVIIDHARNGQTVFERLPNGSIKQNFLNVPGKSLSELRKQFPGTQATRTWEDSMHRQLDVAQKNGVAVFEVNPAGEPIQEATVWGASVIKHKRPDYRTVEVAKAALWNEFPPQELPIESFPAGPNVPFAFQECTTNVDAAFSAWSVTDETARLPFSFIISRDISLKNPYKTVTTNTRADNELLPTLLPKVAEKTGKSLVYVTGVDFQVEHHREASGYRPNIIEQAATSLVDNLYAQGANELMQFKDMYPYLDDAAIDGYSIPHDRALGVFRQLKDLAHIARLKMAELNQRTTHSRDEEEQLGAHLDRYQGVYDTVKGKLGVTHYEEEHGVSVELGDWEDAAFDNWKRELDKTGREQLHYYNDVLQATPIITQEVQRMVDEGVYPVAQVVPNGDPSISVPGNPTRSKSM